MESYYVSLYKSSSPEEKTNKQQIGICVIVEAETNNIIVASIHPSSLFEQETELKEGDVITEDVVDKVVESYGGIYDISRLKKEGLVPSCYDAKQSNSNKKHNMFNTTTATSKALTSSSKIVVSPSKKARQRQKQKPKVENMATSRKESDCKENSSLSMNTNKNVVQVSTSKTDMKKSALSTKTQSTKSLKTSMNDNGATRKFMNTSERDEQQKKTENEYNNYCVKRTHNNSGCIKTKSTKGLINLNGSFKLHKNINFTEFLGSQGVGLFLRNAADKVITTHHITHQDPTIKIRVSGIISSETTFIIDGPASQTKVKDRVYKDYVSYAENGNAIQVMKINEEHNYKIRVLRRFTDETQEMLEVRSTAYFEETGKEVEAIQYYKRLAKDEK